MFRKLIWQKYLLRAIRMKVNFRFLRVIMAREEREREREVTNAGRIISIGISESK